MTLRFFVRRGRISAHPLRGQTGGLYPQARAFVFEIQNFVKEGKSVEREKPPPGGAQKEIGPRGKAILKELDRRLVGPILTF
jgi:hypothetical protein